MTEVIFKNKNMMLNYFENLGKEHGIYWSQELEKEAKK